MPIHEWKWLEISICTRLPITGHIAFLADDALSSEAYAGKVTAHSKRHQAHHHHGNDNGIGTHLRNVAVDMYVLSTAKLHLDPYIHVWHSLVSHNKGHTQDSAHPFHGYKRKEGIEAAQHFSPFGCLFKDLFGKISYLDSG